MEFRRQYGYDTAVASDEAAIPPDGHGESMTIQSQAEEADINVMMARFRITGTMPTSVRVPEYGDFSEITDYRGALHAVMDAQDNFMRLPAAVRARFDNDPQLMLEFVSDPANVPELVKMGLGKENIDVGVSAGANPAASGEAGKAASGGVGDGKAAGGS